MARYKLAGGDELYIGDILITGESALLLRSTANIYPLQPRLLVIISTRSAHKSSSDRQPQWTPDSACTLLVSQSDEACKCAFREDDPIDRDLILSKRTPLTFRRTLIVNRA